MDISELLASMQTNAGDRALARTTHMSTGIPDEATPQEQRDDDDQHFAEGGEVESPDESGREFAAADRSGDKRLADKWENMPDSKNIEDRRGEPPTANEDGSLGPSKTWRATGQRLSNKLLDLKNAMGFADGGEVPDEEVPPEEGLDEAAPPPAQGIPEPPAEGEAPQKPKGARQVFGDAMGMRGRQAQEATQEQGAADWRSAAMEGINKAIDWGYNTIHGVNRGVSQGEQDPEHKAAVHSMMNGHGAMSAQQWDDLMQSVDPTGLMDNATKQMKGISELYQFYGPEKGAAAVWSALQKNRTDYDKARALATVAVEKNKPDAAAAAAQHAFNAVPDGIHTKVSPFRPGSILDRMLGNGAPPPAAGGVAEPTGAGNVGEAGRIGMGDQAMEMDASKNMQGPEAPAFKVVQTDPESGKIISQGTLTNEQLIHAMAQPFDRSLHQGTVQHVGGATQTAVGQGQHMSFGQRLAVANGLPATMDVGGLQTSEIGALRRQYLSRQAQGEDPRLAVAREGNQSRIEAAKISAGSREANNQRSNETKAGIEEKRQTGMNGRQINSPSQQAQNDRAMLNRATAAAENDAKSMAKRPSVEEMQALTQRYLDFYKTQQGGQKPAAPAAAPAAPQAPAAPAQQQQQPQTKVYNGRTYTFDPVKKGWTAQ